MKVLTFEADLCAGAFAEECKAGLMYTINSNDKDTSFGRRGCSLYFTGSRHETFCIYKMIGTHIICCEVVFVAENVKEETLMNAGAIYENECKGQYTALVLSPELGEFVEQLGSLEQ